MSTYYAMDASSSLSHHGILGMKWGIRRYQNADGSLTDAGKKRYLNSDLSGEKTYKSLKKAVQNKRGIQEGQANRWMSGTPIGKHSKQLHDEALADEKRLKSSKEYK